MEKCISLETIPVTVLAIDATTATFWRVLRIVCVPTEVNGLGLIPYVSEILTGQILIGQVPTTKIPMVAIHMMVTVVTIMESTIDINSHNKQSPINKFIRILTSHYYTYMYII